LFINQVHNKGGESGAFAFYYGAQNLINPNQKYRKGRNFNIFFRGAMNLRYALVSILSSNSCLSHCSIFLRSLKNLILKMNFLKKIYEELEVATLKGNFTKAIHRNTLILIYKFLNKLKIQKKLSAKI